MDRKLRNQLLRGFQGIDGEIGTNGLAVVAVDT